MSEGARNVTQEYWRPVQPPQAEMRSMAAEMLCNNCGSEFAVGARFCHVCGNEREPEMRMRPQSRLVEMLNLAQISDRLHLSAAALLFAALGLGCVLGAIFVGVIYSANTVLDWQAVQVWRIQWMLAALVAFVAAILFNNKKTA